MGFKSLLVVVLLVLAAFGSGYGLMYWKLQEAQKEWAEARGEMEARKGELEKQIADLGRELSRAKARESLWELADGLGEATVHLSEKNFGLAIKTLEGLKEKFSAVQSVLGEGIRGQFEFFLPGVEEAQKEAASLGPNTRARLEELRQSFEKALRPAKKGQ